MKALSGKSRSFEAHLALAREGSKPSAYEQERMGRALRAAGLTVPLVVAPGLAGVAQAAVAATSGAATSGAATSGAATSGAATSGAVATSGTLTASANVSASAASIGTKLIAAKLVAAKLAVALAVAGAGTVGVNTGYKLLTTQQPSANQVAATANVVDKSEPTHPARAARAVVVAMPSGNDVSAPGSATVADVIGTTTESAAPSAVVARAKLAAPRAVAPSSDSDGEPAHARTPEPPTEDPVVVEMQHLKQVNRALSSGNPSLALQLLNALDRQIPGGSLQPERQVNRVLALCALGETTQAVALTQKLLGKGNSFYSRSLKHSCGSP